MGMTFIERDTLPQRQFQRCYPKYLILERTGHRSDSPTATGWIGMGRGGSPRGSASTDRRGQQQQKQRWIPTSEAERAGWLPC